MDDGERLQSDAQSNQSRRYLRIIDLSVLGDGRSRIPLLKTSSHLLNQCLISKPEVALLITLSSDAEGNACTGHGALHP